jgi:pSer/pThr/pTyr-binding forkhead associated (FHA) protein
MDVNLVMFKPSGQQKSIPLPRELTVIGRSPECDLRIPIESCSRKQCELRIEGQSLAVRDLGSSNGTFVNGERVETTTLNPGDKLTIGPIILTVQIDGEPADIPAPETPVSSAATAGDDSEELIPLDEGSGSVDPFDALVSQQDGGESGSLDNMDILSSAAGGDEDGSEDPLSVLEALADIEDDSEDKNG